MKSESDKFNDQVFGSCWIGIGLITLWLGLYVIANLPQQAYGDIAYFVSFAILSFGIYQLRRGRDLKTHFPILPVISNTLMMLSLLMYVGCLSWFKFNFEWIVETRVNIAYLMYVIIASFATLTLAVLVNYLPIRKRDKSNIANDKLNTVTDKPKIGSEKHRNRKRK
jgi:di/tricarboxylate transporter